MGKRTLAVLGVMVLAVGVLAACAESDAGPRSGDAVPTSYTTDGEWKRITQLNGYAVDMQCRGTTGIYIFDRYRGFAVLGNDPLCPKKG